MLRSWGDEVKEPQVFNGVPVEVHLDSFKGASSRWMGCCRTVT